MNNAESWNAKTIPERYRETAARFEADAEGYPRGSLGSIESLGMALLMRERATRLEARIKAMVRETEGGGKVE